MFSTTRRKYSGGKRYYRGYTRYKYRRWGSSASRAYASAKSSKAGTKTETYNGQVNGYVTYTLAANQYRTDVQMFMPFKGNQDTNGINIETTTCHGGAVCDRTFRLLCAQYDQVRLVSMKIKLTPSALSTNVSPMKLLSVCDRNCYDSESESIGDDDPIMTAKEIEDNPGVIVTEFNGNRVTPIMRYCTAKDLQERTTYIDSTITYNTSDPSNPFSAMFNADWKDGKAEFAPCFFTCLKSPVTSQQQVTLVYGYTVEYNFIFRNPKNNLDTFVATEVITSSRSMRDMALRMMANLKEEEEKKKKTELEKAVEEAAKAAADTGGTEMK